MRIDGLYSSLHSMNVQPYRNMDAGECILDISRAVAGAHETVSYIDLSGVNTEKKRVKP